MVFLKKVFLSLAGVILLGFLVWFGTEVFDVYRDIRAGGVHPLVKRRLQASISRMRANDRVTSQDLSALTQGDTPMMGAASPTLMIIEFLDYDCPFSRASFQVVRQVVEHHADSVRLIIRDFPIEELHPRAVDAALAARCAQAQGGFWAYHDKLFSFPDQRSVQDMVRFARETGLNTDAFTLCLENRRHDAGIAKDIEIGLRAGVDATPTFFLGSLRIPGSLDVQTLEYAISQLLNQQKKL